ALAVDLARGLRGGVRLTVEVEGEVTPDDADLTLVRLEDLVDRREHASAEGALIVAELLDHDRRVGGPDGGRPRGDRDVVALIGRRRRGLRARVTAADHDRAGLAVLDGLGVDARAGHAAIDDLLGAGELL